MPSKSAEVVELTVPCDAKYLVEVRLATAGVGNRAGLSVEDIGISRSPWRRRVRMSSTTPSMRASAPLNGRYGSGLSPRTGN